MKSMHTHLMFLQLLMLLAAATNQTTTPIQNSTPAEIIGIGEASIIEVVLRPGDRIKLPIPGIKNGNIGVNFSLANIDGKDTM